MRIRPDPEPKVKKEPEFFCKLNNKSACPPLLDPYSVPGILSVYSKLLPSLTSGSVLYMFWTNLYAPQHCLYRYVTVCVFYWILSNKN